MDCAGVAALMDDVALVGEVEPVAVDAEAVVEATWAAPTAMPVPKPRNAATLIAPATTLEREAAWRRRFRPLPGRTAG